MQKDYKSLFFIEKIFFFKLRLIWKMKQFNFDEMWVVLLKN